MPQRSESERLLWHSPAALVSFNLQGVILAHSPVLPEWLGITPHRDEGTLIGRNLVEWLTPGSRLLYETNLIPRLMETGSAREMVLQARDHNGVARSVIFNATLVEEDGEFCVYAALMGANDRTAFERDLLEARRVAETARSKLDLLQSATSQLAIAEGLDDLGHTLAEAGSRAAQSAWTLVRIEENATEDTLGRRVSATERTWGTAPVSVDVLASEGFTPDVLVCRTPQDIRVAMPLLADSLFAAGVEALLVTPILRNERGSARVIGSIHSWFRRSRALEDDVLGVLQSLADQAELVLDHVRLQEGMQYRALHDGLTGLPNRILLQERVSQMLALAQQEQGGCAILFLDLDGFKAINDHLGHLAGDEVLCTIADRISASCRAGETVARLGGDEFVVALTEIDMNGAQGLAQRILANIRQPLLGEASKFPLSASIGIALWHSGTGIEAPLPGDFIDAADAAMYEAKRGGKDAITQRVLQ